MAEREKQKRTVIIAVDGSENATRAFEFYTNSIYRPGDRAILLHAFELPPLSHSSGPFVFAYYEEWSAIVKETREGHEAMLRSFEELCKEKKMHYQILMVVGKPAGDVICKIAKEEGADFIVMGTRGQGVLRRTILGSVSDYVVHHAHLPVAVVPRPVHKEESHE